MGRYELAIHQKLQPVGGFVDFTQTLAGFRDELRFAPSAAVFSAFSVEVLHHEVLVQEHA